MSKSLQDLIPEFPIEGRIKPFRHRLFVHALPSPGETQTDAGIIIPKRAREAEVETTVLAKIIAVGPDCNPDMEPGLWVMLPRFAGTALIHSRFGDEGADYRIVAEDSVMCFVAEEEVAEKHGVTLTPTS